MNVIKLEPQSKIAPANETMTPQERVKLALETALKDMADDEAAGNNQVDAVLILQVRRYDNRGTGISWISAGLSDLEAIGLCGMAQVDVAEFGLDGATTSNPV